MPGRVAVAVAVLAVVVAVLRVGLATLSPTQGSAAGTQPIVLVGLAVRQSLTPAEGVVLDRRSGDAQVGAVSVGLRSAGECAAAGWETLGAGRTTTAGGRCAPTVANGRVRDWPERVAAAAASGGDAHLGTLAGSVPGCVAAVGPGAVLAAARPDGSVASVQTVAEFLAAGARPPCPLTLVDPGSRADEVIAAVTARPGVLLLVTGIAPPGPGDAPLQPVYRLGVTPPGWLTSPSTRRAGLVTLTDLTRTLIAGQRPDHLPATLPVDGAEVQVRPARVSAAALQHRLDAYAALEPALLRGYLALAVGGLLLVALAAAARRRRPRVVRLVMGVVTVLPAAMALIGALPWSAARFPGLAVSLLLAAWAAVLAAVALRVAAAWAVPIGVAGAGLTVVVLTIDAGLGGPLQLGSLLNPRPLDGGRWYGFGNITFAAYAAAGIVLAGYLASRYRTGGRPQAGWVAAAVAGLGVVLCDGWPTLGADFGGVLALTPPTAWLLLRLSGRRVSPGRALLLGAVTVAAAAVAATADWLRGPGARTHLGDFVQRVLDGDAQDVVLRKAVAAAQTIASPTGVVAVVLGVGLWFVILSRLLPGALRGFDTVRLVAIAALATAILGTVLNDSGIAVWIMLTASFAVTAGALRVELEPDPAAHQLWTGSR